jgi:hypothetical protein
MNTSPIVYDQDLIPAPLLSSELQKLTGNPGPGVRKLVELASSARIPLEKSGRFWVCRRDKLPELARALGIATPQPSRKAPRKTSTDSSEQVAA